MALPPGSSPLILAHAGGVDEALFIAVPIALFLLFRWLASRGEPDEKELDEEESAGDR